jgi:hypothetical protein
MASVSWSEQRELRDVFDRFVTSRKSTNTTSSATSDDAGRVARKAALPSLMGLRQTGKSSKYTAVAEKQHKEKVLSAREQRKLVQRALLEKQKEVSWLLSWKS